MPCECTHVVKPCDPRFVDLRNSRFGSQNVITVSNPAAGANFSVTVPGGRAWLVQTVTFRLVTDATAVTRVAQLTVTVQNERVAHILPGGGQAASLTRDYTFAQGVVSNGQGAVITSPIVDQLLLLPASRLDSAVEAIATGDQISNVRLWVVEFDYPE